MDIFTTALTRVVQTPIKPSRLRVKALVKEPATSALTDDLDHLENHEQYFDATQEQESRHKGEYEAKQEKEALSSAEEEQGEGVQAIIDGTILHKKDLINKSKTHKKDENDDDIKHLDLFV
jgi:hypothetical protein